MTTATNGSSLFYVAAGNAAVSSTGDQQWDRAVSTYILADALARADAEFGRNWEASQEYKRAEMRLAQKYGKGFRHIPFARAELDDAFKEFEAADVERDEKYLAAITPSAIALALVPAPTMAAALFKIEIIKREELYIYDDMPRDCFEVVAEDMNRLREAA